MALKPQSGLSLIELVVALSMSALVLALGIALYKDVGTAARLLRGSRDDAFQARAAFASLCDNLLSGGGLVSLGPERLRLLNRAGALMEYAWSDSTLSVNGKPADFRVASLEFVPAGPVLPSGEAWTRARMESAEADSLDDDRDGAIDFDELDRDRNGELEHGECRWVASVTVKLVTIRAGAASTLSATVHPRNRARDRDGAAGQGFEGLPGTGDFGR